MSSNTLAIETLAGIPYLGWIILGIISLGILMILVSIYLNKKEGNPK